MTDAEVALLTAAVAEMQEINAALRVIAQTCAQFTAAQAQKTKRPPTRVTLFLEARRSAPRRRKK
jgi:hypothetical protein